MIIIEEKLGNIHTAYNRSRYVDAIVIEWHETKKRILHKKTKQGKEVAIKFLNENPNLKDGDILWQDEKTLIVVEMNPCECIIITPVDFLTTSSVCYEVGNRHLPLFYSGDELMVPYDAPLYNLLNASGYSIKKEQRVLHNSFQTSVLPHLQVGDAGGLFNKINQLTTSC